MNRAAQLFGLGMALACVALLIAGVFAGKARGHDHNNPALDGWYMGLRSKGGGPCCGGPKIDATTLEDTDWKSVGDHYSVRVDGQWLDVPDEMVVKEPNRAGRTLVWLSYGNGQPFVRCFMPGPMI